MILLALIFHTLTTAHAQTVNPMELSIDCSFRYASFPSCVQIVDDFFNHEKFGTQFSKSSPGDKTAVHVLITDQIRANGNIEFDFHFSADPEYFDMEDIKIGIELDQNLDNVGRLKEIVGAIFKGAIPFLEVKTDISGEDIVVTFKAPEKTPAPDSGSNTPFYGELNTSASTNESSVNASQSANVGAYGSYIGNRFKVQLSTSNTYQSISVFQKDGTIHADNLFNFERGIMSYSIDKKKKWSVALISTHQQNPGSNINNNLQLGGGVEWNLVPYRKNENYQFMFRVGAARSDLALDAPNKIGFTRDQYAFAFANFSAYWLFLKDKLNITASSYYSKNLKYDDYNYIQFNAQVGYKISNSFRINWQVGYQYQKNSITFPGEPDFSNPLKSTFLSNAPGKAFSQSIGISINIGNSTKRVRDLRWNGF